MERHEGKGAGAVLASLVTKPISSLSRLGRVPFSVPLSTHLAPFLVPSSALSAPPSLSCLCLSLSSHSLGLASVSLSLSVSPLLLSLGHTFLSVTAAPPSSRCVSGRTANDAFARSRARSSTGDGSFVVAMSRESAIHQDQSTREITANPMPSLVCRVVLSLEGDPPRSILSTDLRFAQRSGCL